MLSRLGPLVHILTALIVPIWWAVLSDHALSPGMLILCAIFSLLPDIDTATSHIGRLLPDVSVAIERRWGHRTLTHSFGAVLLVALLTLPLTGQWFLVLAYLSHILLDMLIGGNRGVALLWPLRYRFSLGHIHPASPGELMIGLFALALVVVPLLIPTLAVQATAIIPKEPTPTPTRTPTATPTPAPTLVTIRIDHVYVVDAEILVQVGDQVSKGQPVANLIHWRATVQAPPPTPTPTWILLPTLTPTVTPTPYVPPTVNPLDLGAAWADLRAARAQATLAAAPPDPTAIARTCDQVLDMQSQLEAMRNGLWADQLKRDAARLRGDDFAAIEATLFEQERLIAEYVGRVARQQQLCTEIQSQPHRASPEELEIAAAHLQQAEIRYLQAIATPTQPHTPTPTPTRTPTATPTPWLMPSDEGSRIYSLVAGDVYAIHITGVNGNEARVEIDIAIGYGTPPNPPPTAPSPASGEGWGGGGEWAIVTHVRDGDTIDVRFSDGSQEAIRLLDINTPETVKPNAPVECYGPEASRHTKTRLCGDLTGQSCTGVEVQLEIAPERDRYGRLLAYIWLEGELYNEELVNLGLAHFNDYGNPHQYSERIEAATTTAQAEGVGLWGMCPAP
jgi:micrococcal nuclease